MTRSQAPLPKRLCMAALLILGLGAQTCATTARDGAEMRAER